MRTAQFINIFLLALVAGVLWGTWIKRWTPATLPSGWTGIRDCWQFFHTARSFASLAGFGCALASGLFF